MNSSDSGKDREQRNYDAVAYLMLFQEALFEFLVSAVRQDWLLPGLGDDRLCLNS